MDVHGAKARLPASFQFKPHLAIVVGKQTSTGVFTVYSKIFRELTAVDSADPLRVYDFVVVTNMKDTTKGVYNAQRLTKELVEEHLILSRTKEFPRLTKKQMEKKFMSLSEKIRLQIVSAAPKILITQQLSFPECVLLLNRNASELGFPEATKDLATTILRHMYDNGTIKEFLPAVRAAVALLTATRKHRIKGAIKKDLFKVFNVKNKTFTKAWDLATEDPFLKI